MRTSILGAAALTGAITLGVGIPVLAQTATSTPTSAPATTTKSASGATDDTDKADHAAQRTAERADLAARLGITVAKLDEADKAMRLADIDAAVAAGRLTAEQGAALKQAVNTGTRPGGIEPGGRGRGRGIDGPPASGTRPTTEQRKAEADARLTRYLGLLGVSKETYTKAVTDIAKARIDQAVTDGRLTAAQAAARKAVVDADVAAGALPGGGGRGGFGGPGFGGDRGRR